MKRHGDSATDPSGRSEFCSFARSVGGHRFDPGWLHSRSPCKWVFPMWIGSRFATQNLSV
jgi:hypothetical protein